MRLTSTAIPVLAIGLFTSSALRADEDERACKPVHASIVTTLVACPADFASPVGLCTVGTVDSGVLKGTTRFRALSFDPATGMYTGELIITTRSGTVTLRDMGAITPAGFFETEVVTSGTGRLKHATGVLTAQGSLTFSGLMLVGFSGTLSGEICRRSDDDGDDHHDRG